MGLLSALGITKKTETVQAQYAPAIMDTAYGYGSFTTGGVTTDVAATALNGAQISSLIDIVMQSSAGAVPVSSAKAIVQAAFPTLPPATIDAIFADVLPGSLLPTEVIQSSVELKKKVDAAEESYQPTDEMAAEAEKTGNYTKVLQYKRQKAAKN